MKLQSPLAKLRQNWQKEQNAKPQRKPVVFAGAVSFQERRKQEMQQQRRKQRQENWHQRRALVLICLGIAAILIGAALGLYLLRSSNQFRIQEISINGVTAVAEQEVQASLEWVHQESLYGLNLGSIQQDLLKKFPYFREVFVRKILPDRLAIEVVERFPVMTYANLSTSLTLDEEGKVIGIFANNESKAPTLDELNIILGYGDQNSVSVQEKYLNGISDEKERARVNWEEVKPEDKKRALDAVQQELVAKYDFIISERSKELGEQLLANLPILQDLSDNTYKLGDFFPPNQFEFAYDLFRYFQSRQIPIKKLMWQTEFNIIATLPNNGRIIFTTSRPLEDQIAAVETIRKVEDLSRVTLIDVRSNVVSVR